MCSLADSVSNSENTGRSDCRTLAPACVSIIAPIRDEDASIGALIDALLTQSYQPAEIILTDGGSSDQTREIVRELQKSSSVPIVLIETAHAYPGRGRNLAIAQAQNDWIASIDAGIVPDSNWLKELLKAAIENPDALIVYGRFEPVTDTLFSECAAVTYVSPLANSRFIASSLLHKSAWQAANGFREDLRTGEDLVFFENLDKAQVPDAHSQGAVIFWTLRPSFAQTATYFVASSFHSLRAGLFFNWHYNVSRLYLLILGVCLAGYFQPALLWAVPLIFLLRTERRMFRWYRVKNPNQLWSKLLDPSRVLMVTSINLVIDAAMFCGMFLWIMRDCVAAGLERRVRTDKHACRWTSSNNYDSPRSRH
ncbi:MAG: glycosyltransferase [Acidobacteriota bacterium]